jgi:DNA-binding CsgD family transcriptional regulator/tetratricopeptide (TPR) repeat protein
MIVGRANEVSQLTELWRAACEGAGGSLAVVGDAGVGKSTLIEQACADAVVAGVAVVSIEGVRGEEDLAWAGLSQLVTALGSALELLPEHHQLALGSVMGDRPGAAVDRHAVFIAVQALVAEVAADTPRLITVDDLHWLDRESAQALVFLARRLTGLSVALVIGARTLDDLDLPDVLTLGLLDDDAAADLVRSVAAPATVGPFVTLQLVRASRGNPLALRALVDVLTPGQLIGEQPLPNPLPLAPGLESMLSGRVERLAFTSRRSLAALAMSGSASQPVHRVLVVADATLGDLEEAERAGIVALSNGSVRFTHPLYRSAAYWTFDAADRRALHTRCAEAEPDAVRRALHLADAAAEPDPVLGAHLSALAEEASRLGSFTTATSLSSRARDNLIEEVDRQRCDLVTAQAALEAGNLSLARVSIASLTEDLDPVRVRSVRAAVAEASGDLTRSVDDWVAAARLARSVDPSLAADQVITAGIALVRRVEMRQVQTLLRDVDLELAALDPIRQAMIAVLDGCTRLASGQIDDTAIVSFARYEELMALDDAGLAPHLTFVSSVVGPALALFRQHDAAIQVADRIDRIAVQRTQPTVLPMTEATRGMVAFRGNIAAALAHFEQANSLARALGHPTLSAMADGYLGVTQAQLGRPEALVFAQRLIDDPLATRRVAGAMTEGVYWLTFGVPERALVPLLRIHRDPEIEAQNFISRWQADLGEAAARCGQFEIAREAVAEIDALSAHSSETWLIGARERVLGMISPIDDCSDHFGRSVEAMESSLHLSAVARSELLWGERLRRARRRAEARPHLERARDMFQQMGCGRWMERAELELVAAGAAATTSDHSRDAERVLTAQELHVARLAVAGASYKDIAGQLFVSPRTIESHLSSIYRKLGVKNRAGLSARAAQEPALQPVT